MPSRPSIAMRRYRKAAGLSQRELGRRVGCSGPYISQIETGAKIPTYDLDTRIARALGLDGAEDFYGGGRDTQTTKSHGHTERPALTVVASPDYNPGEADNRIAIDTIRPATRRSSRTKGGTR